MEWIFNSLQESKEANYWNAADQLTGVSSSEFMIFVMCKNVKKINFVLLLIECIFSLYMTTIMMYGAYNYIVLVLWVSVAF